MSLHPKVVMPGGQAYGGGGGLGEGLGGGLGSEQRMGLPPLHLHKYSL